MPVRYTQHPAIICPLTIPNQVGYVRCPGFLRTRMNQRVWVILTCFQYHNKY